MRRSRRFLTHGCVAVLAVTVSVLSAQERALTPEEMGKFLRTAEVVDSQRTSKGLTQPWRLTLSDGRITHDASFQSVNTRRNNVTFRDGGAELHFVDSFAYNIAAYRLAGLVGLDDMIPVTVERRWQGERGAISWWVDAQFDDGERRDLGVDPPSSRSWNQQIRRLLVFSALVQDSDRNPVRLQFPDDARTRRAVTIAYEVLVPAGMRVVTHSDSGETRVDGVRGAVSVRTQSGAIKLADLGPTRVDTGSGAVSIDGAGPLSVTTSSSSIEVTRISGNLNLRTQSGRVKASLVNEGDVDVETGSSAITIDGVDGGLAVSTRSGRVRISDNPRRAWQVTTGSSAIEAEFSAHAVFTLDATSGSGSVKTENLGVRGETDKRRAAGTIGGGGPTVRLTSRSGSIKLKAAGS